MSEQETQDVQDVDETVDVEEGQPDAGAWSDDVGAEEDRASPDQAVDASDVVETPAVAGSEGPVTKASIVEAMLLASDSPVGAAKIANLIGDATPGQIKACIAQLNARYDETGASFRIEEIAKGFQILTLPEYNVWLRKLLKVRSETKLSQAALETLAVVAYKQPVVRARIEEIRGVGAGEMLNRLREMNLVKIVGRAEELGRPLLYGTTKRFLEVFGLASLAELPAVDDLAASPAKKKSTETKTADESPKPDVDVDTNDPDAAFARLAEAARATDSSPTDEGVANGGADSDDASDGAGGSDDGSRVDEGGALDDEPAA